MTLSKCITRTNETRATLEFTVECHGEEESHRRPASGASSATWDRVYEYTPAPGQFINELVSGGFTGTETTPEAAVAYAEERMRKNTWVSLGGWGGYIVVGFDHSIDNSSSGYKGGYNFSITGNAFKGSSEPGIVYVMQDTNGNTLPDANGTNSKDRSSARRRPFRITRSPITGRPTREPTYNGRTTRASRARSTT